MKIALGADHRGVEVRKQLAQMLKQEGCEVLDLGVFDGKACDYPDVAFVVANAVAKGEVQRGVLVCGSGIGMSIAANKVKGIRAALVHDEVGAEISRRYNDANILCLSADMLGIRIIERITKTWLHTKFDEGRHARRNQKVRAIEDGKNPSTVE